MSLKSLLDTEPQARNFTFESKVLLEETNSTELRTGPADNDKKQIHLTTDPNTYEGIYAEVKALKLNELQSPNTVCSDHSTAPHTYSKNTTQSASPKKDGSATNRSLQDEENGMPSPLLNAKNSRTGTFFGGFKRRDSNPVLVRDFNQIEKNLKEDKFEDGAGTPLASPGKNYSLGGSINNTSPTFQVSRFAPDHIRLQSSTVVLKPITVKVGQTLKTEPDEKDSRIELPSINDATAKRKWSKLSYVFQSMLLFSREEVKNIQDPHAIFHEIDSFQLRQWKEKKHTFRDISKQDFAREAFQKIRRIQIFSECASIGAPRHINIMQEMIQTDPRRYMVEHDDPSLILNHKNNMGHTPLYIAAKHGNLSAVKLLIENKADHLIESQVSANINKMELPLHAAVQWNHSSVVEYLLQNCSYPTKIVEGYLTIAQNRTIKLLLTRHLQKSPKSGGWKTLIKCFG